jgi:putative (di)nucleoside polyphosphate hydrolase
MSKGEKAGKPAGRIVPAETLPYRPCVGVMVLNRDGLVWAGRRVAEGNSEYDGSPQLWQMPQGGIDEGEEHLAASRRELFEETGMETVSLIEAAPDWFFYDLPAHLIGIGLKGKYRGQKQRWFAFRFHGDEREIRIDPPPAGNEKEWKPMADLPGLIVPFKRKVYDEVCAHFAHLAGTRG